MEEGDRERELEMKWRGRERGRKKRAAGPCCLEVKGRLSYEGVGQAGLTCLEQRGREIGKRRGGMEGRRG